MERRKEGVEKKRKKKKWRVYFSEIRVKKLLVILEIETNRLRVNSNFGKEEFTRIDSI